MDNDIKKSYTKLVILIILFILLALGSTYAWLNLQATSNNNTTGTAGCFEVSYNSDAIKHTNLSTTTSYLEGARTDITIQKSSTCKIYTKASLYINTTALEPYNDGTLTTSQLQTKRNQLYQSGAIKYTVVNSSNTVLSQGSITTTGDKLIASNLNITDGSATTYKIYLWIDSSINTIRSFDKAIYTGSYYAIADQTSTVNGS